MLRVNNIEVIYDDVILVLKGLSLSIAERQIVALLGSMLAADGLDSLLKRPARSLAFPAVTIWLPVAVLRALKIFQTRQTSTSSAAIE